MPPRARFHGTTYGFVALVLHFVTGKSWFVYDKESPKVGKKVFVAQALQANDFLSRIHNAVPNLSFPRKLVETSVTRLFEMKHEEWRVHPSIRDEWVLTLTRRFMNLCRAVNQAWPKTTPPRWAQSLPWVTLETEEDRQEALRTAMNSAEDADSV